MYLRVQFHFKRYIFLVQKIHLHTLFVFALLGYEQARFVGKGAPRNLPYLPPQQWDYKSESPNPAFLLAFWGLNSYLGACLQGKHFPIELSLYSPRSSNYLMTVGSSGNQPQSYKLLSWWLAYMCQKLPCMQAAEAGKVIKSYPLVEPVSYNIWPGRCVHQCDSGTNVRVNQQLSTWTSVSLHVWYFKTRQEPMAGEAIALPLLCRSRKSNSLLHTYPYTHRPVQLILIPLIASLHSRQKLVQRLASGQVQRVNDCAQA